ncbi:hypothetical protein LIER_06278 [Lithospermum erythrorhizon]|uniref:Prolamin-like domain-containing protein n=1 Tax=Lithospermum erythrorhizon TaxID=34254 RepID=A0AAV3P6E1_LITER
MAMLKCGFVVPLFLAITLSMAHFTTTTYGARDFTTLVSPDVGAPTTNDGELVECWEALSEIKACSNEITAFLTSGVADIAPPCCTAIMEITHSCWPAVLNTIGISADQTDILRGYCDAADNNNGNGTTPNPSPSPLVQPIS